MIQLRLAALSTGVLVALAGVSSPAVAADRATQSVTVTMTAARFVLSPKKVHAGMVVFKLVNKSKTVHTFAIAGKKSALIRPGKTGRLTVTLRQGKYTYRSTVRGQAQMKGVLTVTAAAGVKALAFAGTYAGKATTQISDNIATISASGTGKGTPIGAGSITGHGTSDTSQQPCLPFGGTGTITGTAGTISFKVAAGSSGCGDEGGHIFTIAAHLVVLKASGTLANAKGTLKLTGTYNHDDGSFSVKISGSLAR